MSLSTDDYTHLLAAHLLGHADVRGAADASSASALQAASVVRACVEVLGRDARARGLAWSLVCEQVKVDAHWQRMAMGIDCGDFK